ncbi:2TM domain-containing protein [Spirosoma rigui]|uniref:2TM domain-containing protein n=1 Tax=Spirosoma rigui TaxID=564064 RepID=UPI0009B18FA5|nr:2TM domain-containing protein [Spirosoma rigui]
MESQRDPHLWKQAKARVGFRMHFRSYLVINAGLWLIWALSTSFLSGSFTKQLFPWPLFAMLGWGIGLAMHYVSVYNWAGKERSMAEQEYQKLLKQSVS